jgi:outer membrane protein OmpA-like peptidoglycan-associated protein
MSTLKRKVPGRALTAALVSFGFVLPAFAGAVPEGPNEPSKQSDLGAITGIAVGAVAAGPVGAIVGGVAGALIGDRYHRQKKAVAAVTADLDKSEDERARLVMDLSARDASLAKVQAHDSELGETLKRADQIGLDVSFRTNDDSIPEQTLPPLQKIGALAASMPDTMVRIAGYADPRGSDAYNDALSLRRAQGVAALLTAAGVPAGRILIEGHGSTESQTAQGDLDGYAFDRRVTVRLEQPGTDRVASRD